jgi:hypothetical protein
MSDYLTQLVARSLAMAPVVRPRSMPLFAPERGIVQPAFAPEPSLEATTAAATPRPFYDGGLSAPQAPLATIQPHVDQPQTLSDMVSATPRQHPAPPVPPGLIEPLADGASLSEPVAPRRQPAHIVPEPLSSLVAIQPTPVLAAENGPPRGDVVADRPAPQRLVIERVAVPEASYSVAPPHPAPSSPETIAPRRQPAQVVPQPLPSSAAQLSSPAIQPAPEPAPQRLVIEQTIVLEPSHSADPLRPAPSPQVVEQPRVVPAAAGAQPTPPSHSQSMMAQPSVLPAASIIQPARRSMPATNVPSARRSTPPTVAPQPAATTEPTIHVTIGRIEVRAAPPPTPAARPRSAPVPAMSLDDYLRERGGGRR